MDRDMTPASPSLKRPLRSLGRGCDLHSVSPKALLRHGMDERARLTTPQLLSFHLSLSTPPPSPVKKMASQGSLTHITEPTAALSSSASFTQVEEEEESVTSLQRRWMTRLARMDDIDRVSPSSPSKSRSIPSPSQGIPKEIFVPILDFDGGNCHVEEVEDDEDDLLMTIPECGGVVDDCQEGDEDDRLSDVTLAAHLMACVMLMLYLFGFGSTDFLAITIALYAVSNLSRSQANNENTR